MEPSLDSRAETPPTTGEGTERPPPVKLIDFRTYSDAQAAVDRLSDLGFPVATVSIVWAGLRRVERVTGRRTIVSAAIEGAIGGAWFGTLFGLLVATLTELPDGGTVFSVALTYLIVGALAGAVWFAGGHALRRGSRDFSTLRMMDAERYELWVDADHADLATDLLSLHTHRPQDPDGLTDAGPAPATG